MALSHLRTPAETVTLVSTLLAPGCPRHALVVACRFDERTVEAWGARVGVLCEAVQASLVEPPRALGPVQADERRVKNQGDHVWVALAMRVKTRVWRAGEVSEPRERTLLRQLIERVRRGVAHWPLP